MSPGTKDTLKMLSVMLFFALLIALLTIFLKSKNQTIVNPL